MTPDTSALAGQMYDKTVTSVAQSGEFNAHRVEQIGARLRPQMVPMIEGLLTEMVTKAKGKQGGELAEELPAKRTLLLVGCGKAKGPSPAAARKLYTGSLTRDRIQHAEASGARWWIVSAQYGLLDPDQEIKPYERTVESLPKSSQSHWSHNIRNSLEIWLRANDLNKKDVRVELHASGLYAKLLRRELDDLRGWEVFEPTAGMTLPQQRAWYAQRRRAAQAKQP